MICQHSVSSRVATRDQHDDGCINERLLYSSPLVSIPTSRVIIGGVCHPDKNVKLYVSSYLSFGDSCKLIFSERFTPTDVVDKNKEKDWAANIGLLLFSLSLTLRIG